MKFGKIKKFLGYFRSEGNHSEYIEVPDSEKL